MPGALPGSREDVLRGAAAHYYESCLLWEDEDLDPGDAAEVLRRAFLSSDCDDFALALSWVTGWEAVRFDFLTRDGEAGHHALVREPGGRLLDAAGWTDAAGLARRYRARRGSASLSAGAPVAQNVGGLDDEGRDEELAQIVGVIRSLPHAPYGEPWFREMSGRDVPGVDAPEAARPGMAP